MDELIQLSDLLKTKNDIDSTIARLIGRPAQIGHLGEYIASRIFDIQLEYSAARKAIDGYFQAGSLVGKSVNIKWYAKQEAMLDITPDSLPDYYLVLSGPVAPASSSRGATRPWVIDHVYLFQANRLVEKLYQRGVKLGVATSVPKAYWEEAEIYPVQRNVELLISERERYLLALFASSHLGGPD